MNRLPTEPPISGFTLIEVIAAVSLLALALLGILQGQSGSVQSIVRSEALSQAYLLAQEKMTELETQLMRNDFEALPEESSGGYNEPKLSGFQWTQRIERIEVGCFLPLPPDELTGDAAEAGGLMTLAGEIFENHVRQLTVSVEWVDSNRPLRAELNQLFVRYADIPQFNLN